MSVVSEGDVTGGGDSKRVAVLIDGENFPAELADRLFANIAPLGNSIIRRVYGSSAAMANWRDRAWRHGIALREGMPGKNAADIHLAIEAMDILHRGRIDAFCIVSSDSDFTALAARLREDGVTVNGFGGSHATARFKDACDTFVELNKPTPAAQPPAVEAQPFPKVVKASGQQAVEERTKVLLLKAFRQLQGAEWYPLSTLLGEVRKLQPQFTARAFGASKPITLVRRTQCFDDEVRNGTMMVRRRSVNAVSATLVTEVA
jgi:hypothetical protein